MMKLNILNGGTVMESTIVKWLRRLTIVVLTIVANQNGNLVPDRTEVIQSLTDMLNESTLNNRREFP